MSEPIRTFLALPISDQVREYLEDIVAPLKAGDQISKMKWTSGAGRHITVSFLGDTAQDQFEALAGEFAQLCQSLPAFKLSLTDTGTFPHANQPKVLWIGCEPHDTVLGELKLGVDKILAKYGYEVDNRKFKPHITLGRVKYLSNQSNLVHDLLSRDVVDLSFQINRMVWYESMLRPAGAEYRELESFDLKVEAHDGR